MTVWHLPIIPKRGLPSRLASVGLGAGEIALDWTDPTAPRLLAGDRGGVPRPVVPSVHTHAIADIAGLQATLDGKASTSHTHDYSAVYAALGHVHAYSSLTGIPATFAPPIATVSILGGVKVGAGLVVDAAGVLSCAYVLPAASAGALGGVKTGANVTIDANGVISVAAPYSHPVGDGNLHVPATGTTSSLKVLKAGATAGSSAWAFVDWAELTGKPSTFAPSGHSHLWADLPYTPANRAGDSFTGKVGIGAAHENLSVLQVIGSAGAGQSLLFDNGEIKFRGDGNAHWSIFNAGGVFSIRNTSANSATGFAGTTIFNLTSAGAATFSSSVAASSFSGAGSGLTGTASNLTAGAANAAPWSGITGKPTTVAGFGITDAITTANIGSQSVFYASTAGALGANALSNAMMAQMGAYTIKGNNGAAAANPADLSMAQLRAMLGLTLSDLPAAIQTYDFTGMWVGKPSSSQVIFRAKAGRPFTIPTGTHQAVAGTAATASTTFSLQKNGTQFGTMAFAAAGTVPTFTVTATSFAAGDVFTIVAPATADSTLADLAYSILGAVQ